jgi:hypothetical protein
MLMLVHTRIVSTWELAYKINLVHILDICIRLHIHVCIRLYIQAFSSTIACKPFKNNSTRATCCVCIWLDLTNSIVEVQTCRRKTQGIMCVQYNKFEYTTCVRAIQREGDKDVNTQNDGCLGGSVNEAV